MLNTKQQPIAVGRTAEIYPYADGRVVKLFFPTIPRLWIDYEAATGRYIQDAHLPVPKLYERVREDGRDGLVYERIEGPSLLSELARKPWRIREYGRLLATLHARVHEVPAPSDLQTQRDWARGGIPETDRLPDGLKGRVLGLLDSMADGSQLCHGDFHPGNIIMTQRGAVIIDWMTASRGTGCGDAARTSIILEAAQVPEGTPMRWLLEYLRKLFHTSYIKTYSRLRPVEQGLFNTWRAIMAANFLADVSLAEEEGNLMSIIKGSIK